MTFTFNKRWDDLEQVAKFLPEFERVRDGIVEAGRYPYNDDFKGRIPSIKGDDEGRAIYLLQRLRREREQETKVAQLLADGFEEIAQLSEVEKFKRIVLVPSQRHSNGEWAEYESARLVPESNPRQTETAGHVSAVLPKGRRTHGERVNGRRVLAVR